MVGPEPEGSFELLSIEGTWGALACASSGNEVSCWGDGWNGGVPSTFTFAD